MPTAGEPQRYCYAYGTLTGTATLTRGRDDAKTRPTFSVWVQRFSLNRNANTVKQLTEIKILSPNFGKRIGCEGQSLKLT